MRGDSSAAPRARRGFVAARAGRGKCEGEKQIPPGKGRALPEKPHSFERKKKCKKKKRKSLVSPRWERGIKRAIHCRHSRKMMEQGVDLHLGECRTKNTQGAKAGTWWVHGKALTSAKRSPKNRRKKQALKIFLCCITSWRKIQ